MSQSSRFQFRIQIRRIRFRLHVFGHCPTRVRSLHRRRTCRREGHPPNPDPCQMVFISAIPIDIIRPWPQREHYLPSLPSPPFRSIIHHFQLSLPLFHPFPPLLFVSLPLFILILILVCRKTPDLPQPLIYIIFILIFTVIEIGMRLSPNYFACNLVQRRETKRVVPRPLRRPIELRETRKAEGVVLFVFV